MKTNEVLNAINARLLEKWPERTVYVDVCPINFDRPSFWLAVERNSQTDANRWLIRRELQIRLTLYDQTDDHYEASWYRLTEEADDALALLTPPLKVGTRHLKLDLKALPRDADRAYLQINAVWMDDRPEAKKEPAPAADAYAVSIRTNTK